MVSAGQTQKDVLMLDTCLVAGSHGVADFELSLASPASGCDNVLPLPPPHTVQSGWYEIPPLGPVKHTAGLTFLFKGVCYSLDPL